MADLSNWLSIGNLVLRNASLPPNSTTFSQLAYVVVNINFLFHFFKKNTHYTFPQILFLSQITAPLSLSLPLAQILSPPTETAAPLSLSPSCSLSAGRPRPSCRLLGGIGSLSTVGHPPPGYPSPALCLYSLSLSLSAFLWDLSRLD